MNDELQIIDSIAILQFKKRILKAQGQEKGVFGTSRILTDLLVSANEDPLHVCP